MLFLYKREKNEINVFIQLFIYILAKCSHANTHILWGTLESESANERERLNFSFKHTSRFCSNLMTQDLALYLDLLLQDFILILNKCSHMGTENKTGKCCLSFPFCFIICLSSALIVLFCPTNVGHWILLLSFPVRTFSNNFTWQGRAC